jgi:putative lipoprotein
MNAHLVAVVCSLALVLSCQSPPLADRFDDVTWRLIELDGTTLAVSPDMKQPDLRFDPGRGTAAGFAGCNRFSGTFQTDGARLRFGPIVATRMACPEPTMQLETAFLGALDATTAYALDGKTLAFLAGERVAARFTRE